MTNSTVDPHTPKNEPTQAWWQPGVLMFARMSAWIVAPILLGTLLGRWLDQRFGTEPWMFISVVGLAFLLSMFGLVKNVVIEYKKIEKELGESTKNHKNNIKLD